ncbi:MAG: glycoside hydrolase family 5 protein [Actinomycetota bacterium]|nr:glycoside hydrolase family 5 protein [Actinomycetota bacterium]
MATVVCGPGATGARGSAGQLTTVEDPTYLLGSETVREQTLSELQSLGVNAIRMTMYWEAVAPSPDASRRPAFDQANPASYDWGSYGQLAADVHARGMRLLIDPTGPVPRWATKGAKDHLTYPSATEYRAFMTAVGRRFGADATAFSIWNEPNLVKFLAPQFARGRAVSPGLYRSLFFAGYNGLRAAGVHAPILAGETAPVGNPITVAPLRFLRGVLCLDAHYRSDALCVRLPANGWATHPYIRAMFPTALTDVGVDDIPFGAVGRLVTALDRAAAAGRVARHLSVYLTEFGVESYPNTISGVPVALQSDYRSIAEYLAYASPRVASFSQYLLTDSPPIPGPAVDSYQFQTGLYLYAGHRPKPSYDGFRLPMVARRHGSKVSLWGLVRPARAKRTGGVVTVLYADRGDSTYRVLLRTRCGASGAWTATARYRSGRHWEVRWRNAQQQTFTGPPTAAYAF